MAAQINTNLYSLNAQRNLSKNSLGLATAVERLSSGLRVNSAKDDAAGLAVSLGIDASSRGIASSIRNASDQISQAQVADGALGVVGDILLRMAELDAQAGNSTLNSTQQGYINSEYTALSASITTIQGNAKLNGSTAFTGSIASVASVTGTAGAGSAGITAALGSVAASRAAAGATINNLQFQIQSYEVNYENQLAAKSRIVDADFAAETANLSRFQILQQAGTAMVAQANAIPQNVLTLLR